MNRIKYLAAVLALLVLLSACGGKNAGSTEAAADETGRTEALTTAPTAAAPETAPAEPSETVIEAPPIQTVPETGTDHEAATEPDPTEPETAELPGPTDPEPERPALNFTDLAEPVPAADYDEILASFLAADFDRRFDFYSRSRTGEEGDEPVFDIEPEDSSAVLPITGVETGSRAKTSGNEIYLIDSYGLIVQSAAGAESEQLSYTEVKMGDADNLGRAAELYADGDRVAVVYEISAFGTDENGDWFDRSETHAAIFDVSDPAAPTLLCDRGVDGRRMSSRLVDGTLYLITNHELLEYGEDMDPTDLAPNLRTETGGTPMSADRIWICANPRRAGFTAVLGLSLKDGTVVDQLAFTDLTDWFCMDRQGMYLARDVWDWTESEPYPDGVYTVKDYADRCLTEIKRLTRTDEGKLGLDALCFVEGSPACIYGMSPRDGGLRLVTREERGAYSSYTDEAQGWSVDRPGGAESRNRLTVLDGDLREVASFSGFAGDDRLFSCGYDGGTGWAMTYAEPEQCWPLELSDPEAPAVGEALDMGTEAWILRPYSEDQILGVRETEDGLVVALYAVGDLTRPIDEVTVPSATTEAVSFPAAVWQDADNHRLGFPVRTESGYGYALFEEKSAGLELVEITRLDYLPGDALTLQTGGLLYVCSPGGTYVIDPETGALLTSISNAVG